MVSNVEPEVGMFCTVYFYSDREPGQIVKIDKNGKRIYVARVPYKRIDNNGMSDCQEYEYEHVSNESPISWIFTLRKNGSWIQEGDSMRDGLSCGIGYARKYFDYMF